jgi:hypothetical protein
MGSVGDIVPEDKETRLLICNSIYTIQQSIVQPWTRSLRASRTRLARSMAIYSSA